MPKTVSTLVATTEQDDGYQQLEELIRQRVAGAQWPLFTTSRQNPGAENLFAAFLSGLPADRRQYYTCNSCGRFVERYGNLVTVDDDGSLTPMLWTTLASPDFFKLPVAEVFCIVENAKITGVFLSREKTWGTPFNVPGKPSRYEGVRWTHLSGTNPKPFSHATLTADQVMAEKTQDYITLHKGLSELPIDACEQAVRVLAADAVDRSEKALAIAEWLLALKRSLGDRKGRPYDNLVWRAVALAPPGFCHISSTMISTLLDDIIAGQPFDVIRIFQASRHRGHGRGHGQGHGQRARVRQKQAERRGAARQERARRGQLPP